MDLVTEFTIFVLAAFVGFEVISKVPTTLHTPLMSQTNAIHGIVMLGGLIVAGFADGALELTLAFIEAKLKEHRITPKTMEVAEGRREERHRPWSRSSAGPGVRPRPNRLVSRFHESRSATIRPARPPRMSCRRRLPAEGSTYAWA